MAGVGIPCQAPEFSKLEFTDVSVLPIAVKPVIETVPAIGACSVIPKFELSAAS